MVINFVISPFLLNTYTEQLYSSTPMYHFPLTIYFLGQFMQTHCQPFFHPSLPLLLPPFKPTPVEFGTTHMLFFQVTFAGLAN